MSTSERSSLLGMLGTNGCTSGFKAEPIPDELLEQVLAAACQTSSPWNLLPSQFVVVRSQAARARVLSHCPDAGSVGTAPVLLVALGDPGAWKRAPERVAEMVRAGLLEKSEEAIELERIRRLWSSTGAARILAIARTHAALQQLWLAARASEIGVCWAPEFDAGELSRALHIPESLIVVGVLGLGYCRRRVTLPGPALSRMVFCDAYGLPMGQVTPGNALPGEGGDHGAK